MEFPKLFKRTKTGAIQTWQIFVDGDAYYTKSGQKDGKITVSKHFRCESKNIGRANETTGHEQAISVAESKWRKQLEKSYVEDEAKIDANEINRIEPMTAKKWEDCRKKVCFPLYSQAKLDGARILLTKDRAVSRGNKDWVTVPHIVAAVAPIFEKYPTLILDGELYNHSLHDDFNQIMSIVRKTKPTEEDLARSAEVVQFHWYDLQDTDRPCTSFNLRTQMIQELAEEFPEIIGPVQIVKSTLCKNEKELDAAYSQYISEGYEGQMVRVPNSMYVNKRSSELLKRKEFQDAEYKILEVGEGNGNKAGMAGFMTLTDGASRVFSSNIKGTHDYLKDLWKKKDELVGQYATCKFFELTPDGIPRFPYVIGIRPQPGQDT
jgi:DNA ligase-1